MCDWSRCREAAVVVAHPDDETLWAGGLLLLHPDIPWRVFTLCRGSDPDRAPRFVRVLEALGATGSMADMDDGPEQCPLPEDEMDSAVLSLLGTPTFDLMLTHGPLGEYTRHRRHEEVSASVTRLWMQGRIQTKALWLFSYDDAGRTRMPRARADAHVRIRLEGDTWAGKRSLITEVYGFSQESWEAQAAPRVEAFWQFHSPEEYAQWRAMGEPSNEGVGAV